MRSPGFALRALAAAAAAASTPLVSGEDGYHSSSASAGLIGWAARGRLDKIMSMLAQRADVRATDTGGGSPVHAAARRGHGEALRLLLSHPAACRGDEVCAASGMDKTAVVVLADTADSQGLRPLHIAAMHGHEGAVEVLLEHGASPGQPPDIHGHQPLHLAARFGSSAVARVLLEWGAPVDPVDGVGCTPLTWSAFSGRDAVAALLLRQGAAVDVRDADGQTPLHWAARGHAPVVRVLLLHRASPVVEDADGNTPADWAEQGGHSEISALLLAARSQAGDAGLVEGLTKLATAPRGSIASERRRASRPWETELSALM